MLDGMADQTLTEAHQQLGSHEPPPRPLNVALVAGVGIATFLGALLLRKHGLALPQRISPFGAVTNETPGMTGLPQREEANLFLSAWSGVCAAWVAYTLDRHAATRAEQQLYAQVTQPSDSRQR
jgi:hypothetical protein